VLFARLAFSVTRGDRLTSSGLTTMRFLALDDLTQHGCQVQNPRENVKAILTDAVLVACVNGHSSRIWIT